jgi:hypothetical protein
MQNACPVWDRTVLESIVPNGTSKNAMSNFINILPLPCLPAGEAGQFEKSKLFLVIIQA